MLSLAKHLCMSKYKNIKYTICNGIYIYLYILKLYLCIVSYIAFNKIHISKAPRLTCYFYSLICYPWKWNGSVCRTEFTSWYSAVIIVYVLAHRTTSVLCTYWEVASMLWCSTGSCLLFIWSPWKGEFNLEKNSCFSKLTLLAQNFFLNYFFFFFFPLSGN